jgi:undecaprenyl-diphosphatase
VRTLIVPERRGSLTDKRTRGSVRYPGANRVSIIIIVVIKCKILVADSTTAPTDAAKIVGPLALTSHGYLRTEKLFDRLNAFEAPFVRWIVVKSQRQSLHRVCLTINRLGNGWLYLTAGIVILSWRGFSAWRPIATATGSVTISFAVYYLMKPCLHRLRPYDLDPTLPRSIKALDTYSCPSGHCMTLCAAGVALASSYPYTVPAVFLALILMAWASLALAHHHGTDVILGCVIGSVISLSLCHLVF